MRRISPEKLLEFLRKNFTVKSDESREVKLCCPECPGGDTEGHLYVNLDKGVGHCYRCHFSPNFNNREETTTASADISDWGGIVNKFLENQTTTSEAKNYSVVWPESMEFLPSDCVMGRRAQRYLEKRGFQYPGVAKDFKFGVCNSGEMIGRLILPVFEQGRLVYYTGRTLLGHEKKYLNPDKETAPKGKAEFLFNLDKAVLFNTAVIVEGILDGIRVGENVVGLLGNNISDIQLEKLLLAGFEKVLVCLDSDARAFAIELGRVLNPHIETWICFLPRFDPDKYLLQAGKIKKDKYIFHPQLDSLTQRFHPGLALG